MRAASERFAAAIRESDRVAVAVNVGGKVVAPIDGSVTLDSTSAIRGRVDLTFAGEDMIPTDQSHPLAPYGQEVQVFRGVRFDDGPELVSLGVFRIEEPTSDDTGDDLSVKVTGLDRSAFVVDARFEAPYSIAAGTNLVTALRDMILDGYPAAVLDLGTTSLESPGVVYDEGSDRWDACREIAKSMGCEIYFDGDGVCVLRSLISTGGPVAWIDEGEDGVILSPTKKLTRDRVYNRWIARGENPGLDNAVTPRGIATDDNPLSPTFYDGPFGHKPYFYASQFIATNAQAQGAAEGLKAKAIGLNESIGFGALVDPRLEPSDTVRIRRQRLGIDADYVLDSLTIPLSAEGTMTGQTRSLLPADE